MANANTKDLLGAMLRRGMTDSSADRIGHSLSERGIGGLGGILEEMFGVTPAQETVGTPSRQAGQSGPSREAGSSNPMDALGNLGQIAKSIFGDSPQGKSLAVGGLGALIGAIFGGGKGSAKGALGGGALALLGSIALKALRAAASKQAPAQLDSSTKLMAGLREPEGAQEESEVQSILDLTVKAMINAAKADGRIDEDEMQKIVGEMQEDGIDQAERDYLLAEVRKPINTREIVAAVKNPQVGAQVYAASLLAIEVDSPAEEQYLMDLARELKLDDQIVGSIHSTLGMA